jgi:hypothetical protein
MGGTLLVSGWHFINFMGGTLLISGWHLFNLGGTLLISWVAPFELMGGTF